MSVQHVQQVSSRVSSSSESLRGFASTVRLADASKAPQPGGRIPDRPGGRIDEGVFAYCAGCGTEVLADAPVVTLSDTEEAMAHGGTDWHPGCWAAQHLALARAALENPSERRSV